MTQQVRRLGMTGSLLALVTLAGCAPSKSWRETVRAIDAKLEQNRHALGRYEITSDVKRDKVQLEGWVESSQARVLAGDLVRQVQGVQEVQNNLEVRRPVLRTEPPGPPLALESLTRRLEDERQTLGDYRITLQQRGTTVVVGGTADSDVTASRLLAKMQQYAPEYRFQNELRIVRHDDHTIASEIGAAIRREGFNPPAVRVSNGIVVLQGDADSHVTIDKFMTLAQMVRGVRDVRNEMTIHGRPYAEP